MTVGDESLPGLEVKKTYKLFVGGEFVRTESGRSDPILSPKKKLLANVSRGSRKDLRDAVQKARAAQSGWAKKTPYLRGQILYRMAEMLEGRAPSFETLLRESRGLAAPAAKREVRAAIDRLVHYAGWSDKYGALLVLGQPRRLVLLRLLGARADGSRRHRGAGDAGSPRPRLPSRARHRGRQHGRRAPLGEAPARLARARRGPGDLGPAGGRREPDLRPQGRARAAPGAPHGRQRDRRRRRRRGALEGDRRGRRRQRQAREARYAIGDYFSEKAQGLDFIEAFIEIKTTWHPIGV